MTALPLATLALSLLGSDPAPPPAAAPPDAAVKAEAPAAKEAAGYQPTGELQLVAMGTVGASASWDARRVVGSTVSMAVQQGGGWAGTIRGRDVVFKPFKDKLSGAGVTLTVRRDGDVLRVEGLWFQQRVRLDLSPKGLAGRKGACSPDLRSGPEPGLNGEIGCTPGRGQPLGGKATLHFRGDAATAPPLPQLVFALLAVLPG